MDIAQIEELRSYQDALHALGFSGNNSLEQFIAASQVAGPELATYLGVSVTTLAETVNVAASATNGIPQSAQEKISHATYSLGVAIEQIPPRRRAPSITTAAVGAPNPSEVNLISQMPTVRNQEQRGTCVAHAALSAYEHFLMTYGAYQDLSEQFLYWNCKRNDGIPNTEGTWLAIAVPLLQREGCCFETTWPYNPSPIVGNESQGPAPGGAQLEALSFRAPNYKMLSPTSVYDIKNELSAGRCVAFSIPVFNSWLRSSWVAYSGDITMPVPNEVIAGGHAMCFVGYTDSADMGLGGGRFILRNSWGTDWGINSPYGSGYGSIPYAYVARLGAEAYSLF